MSQKQSSDGLLVFLILILVVGSCWLIGSGIIGLAKIIVDVAG